MDTTFPDHMRPVALTSQDSDPPPTDTE